MSRLIALVAAAALIAAAGCARPEPEPEPDDALSACVEDWRRIYAADGTPWPGDPEMRAECRLELDLRRRVEGGAS